MVQGTLKAVLGGAYVKGDSAGDAYSGKSNLSSGGQLLVIG